MAKAYLDFRKKFDSSKKKKNPVLAKIELYSLDALNIVTT